VKQVCVFCGSSSGTSAAYIEAAEQLGCTLASRGLTVVYGGARVGMMGHLARAAVASGGSVIGVITQDLVKMEVAFVDLPDLRVVGSMHERKALMFELSDAFIALPGGFGTFEEFFEVLTWAQLGKHQKPCGLLNVAGYYDRLMDFLDQAVEQQFINKAHREMVLCADNVEALLEKFVAYQAPQIDKAEWVLRMAN
jgi:uncharacterized protein (TIGR00730 family)